MLFLTSAPLYMLALYLYHLPLILDFWLSSVSLLPPSLNTTPCRSPSLTLKLEYIAIPLSTSTTTTGTITCSRFTLLDSVDS